jgi:hypothetical protein
MRLFKVCQLVAFVVLCGSTVLNAGLDVVDKQHQAKWEPVYVTGNVMNPAGVEFVAGISLRDALDPRVA